MIEKFPIGKSGLIAMEKELHYLKTKERSKIIIAIAEAKAHGDLSENAEYNAARDKQGFIEAKIADLESKVSRAEVIDIHQLSGDKVQFGATVKIVDEETDEALNYTIVSDYEADLTKSCISVFSPVARALMGLKVNDSAEVDTPKGMKYYQILGVSYK